jgi:hypothetical protein
VYVTWPKKPGEHLNTNVVRFCVSVMLSAKRMVSADKPED